MHKRLKNLIRIVKDLFSLEFIERLSKKVGFVKRKGSLSAEDFLAFNIFSSHDMCETSLSTLCSRLEVQFGTLISSQALNKRYNKYAVKFMQEIFNEMLNKQHRILKEQSSNLNLNFNRILINDSTSLALPKEFINEFKGSGNENVGSAMKIQLQYDLLSGNFNCCDIKEGIENDAAYISTMKEHTKENDLRLADLGYYRADYLNEIEEKKAFYISKLKSNTAIYIESPNPERYKTTGNIKKSTMYKKIDIYELTKPLADGQTVELKNIYIGSKKELKSRLIISKLTAENKMKREKRHEANVKKKRGTFNERSINWTGLNVYITNVDSKVLSYQDVHEVYSLRWQIELMFKIWKSIFKINRVKKVKIERFKCFLYGRLISLLLSSSIVFTAKDIILQEDNKEISDMKSFQKVVEYFPRLRVEIFEGEIAIIRSLQRLIKVIRKLGVKSKKKNRKTVNEIISLLEKSETKLEKAII